MQHGEALRSTLPNGRLTVINNCGRSPMAQKRETFNRLVRDFSVGMEGDIPDAVRA